MKLTAILLLSACLTVSAKGFSQITLSETNVPLQKVFKEIKKQTGYSFLYSYELVQQAGKVSVELKDASLQQAVEEALKGKDLTYEILEKTVVIKEKAPLTSTPATTPPPIDVKGRIVNENGEPVLATVMVKGTNKGTTTNNDGYFELKNVDDNATLVITASNIETREIQLNGRSDLAAVTIKMKNTPLDEMQIIAYGQTTRRYNTGNVSTVKAKDIEKQPVQNPLLALQGRVPGLVVEQANGLPGSGVKVRIQGQNSLSMGSDPLIIIDGVAYPSQMLPTLQGILGKSGDLSAGSGNPLSYVNPSDIESIDVLKDADATSIYGSRAAAGAILITTKKGKTGPMRVNLNLQNGWGQVARKLDLLSTQQYLEIRREAFANDNAVPSSAQYDINGTWDTTQYTDWQKELIGGTAQYLDAQASASGGTPTVNYLISGGYHRETTVFPGDLTDQKGTLHFNLNSISSNRKFRTQLSGSYVADDNKLIDIDLTEAAVHLAPNAPKLYQPDGSINWEPLSNGRSTWTNPISNLNRKYNSKTDNLISNLSVGYKILNGLEIKNSLGYSKLLTKEVSISPKVSARPELTGFTRRSSFGDGSISTWQIEPQLTYDHSFSFGTLSAIVGSTILQTQSDRQAFAASGFNTDAVLEDVRAAASVTVSSTTASVYRYNALFGRITYNQKNKYLLNLSARRDGSSRFGAENQFHNFGSIGAAWIFSNENFAQKAMTFLSFGKIKVSYGTTGNDQIGDYAFMNLFESRPQSSNYQGIVGVAPINLPNPYLQWEETKKFQVGLDLGFWRDKVLLSANYYDNRSSNQLQGYSLPITAGFGYITENFPATIKNYGWEFSLTTTNFRSSDFSWTTNVNLTIPKNELLKFPGLETSSAKDFLEIGKSIAITKLYQFAGVDPTTGLYQFFDKDGHLTSDPGYGSENKVAIINRDAKFYGGFQNNISYRGIELSFLFQFFKQIGTNYLLGYQPGSFSGTSNLGNQPTSVLGRWQSSGDNSQIQKLTSIFFNYPSSDYAEASTAAWSDASYIRLKNLSLSYRLPMTWYTKLHIQQARIYAQGQNLLTFTNYKGLDPETKSSITLPPLRVVIVGIQIGL